MEKSGTLLLHSVPGIKRTSTGEDVFMWGRWRERSRCHATSVRSNYLNHFQELYRRISWEHFQSDIYSEKAFQIGGRVSYCISWRTLFLANQRALGFRRQKKNSPKKKSPSHKLGSYLGSWRLNEDKMIWKSVEELHSTSMPPKG